MQIEIPKRLKNKQTNKLKADTPSKYKTSGQVVKHQISRALKDYDNAEVQFCSWFTSKLKDPTTL